MKLWENLTHPNVTNHCPARNGHRFRRKPKDENKCLYSYIRQTGKCICKNTEWVYSLQSQSAKIFIYLCETVKQYSPAFSLIRLSQQQKAEEGCGCNLAVIAATWP